MVVGLGKRGKHHAAAFQANPAFKVTGICDVSTAALDTAVESLKLGDVAKGTDAAKMAKDIRPDLFCFCTMPNLRYEMLRVAADCGAKMVAFEKPVALNMKEAVKMKKLVDSSGIKAVVSHQHRYGAHYRKVKEIVSAGSLGRIQTVYGSSTGWMAHMMSHMLDYMAWFNNYENVEWVMGQAAGRGKMSDSHPSPDYLVGIIQYANGVRGYVECGAGAPDQPEVAKWWGKNRIGAQGTEGLAELLTNGGWRSVTRDGLMKGDGAMNYDLDMPPYIADMAAWLDKGIVHPCCFDNAYKGCETMMAIIRSSVNGGQMAIPLQPDDCDELSMLASKLPQKPVIPTPVCKDEYLKK